MSKKLKITYSSFHNISFRNDFAPDYIDLPDDWDEMSEEEQQEYIDETLEQYLWELVELDYEVVEGKED